MVMSDFIQKEISRLQKKGIECNHYNLESHVFSFRVEGYHLETRLEVNHFQFLLLKKMDYFYNLTEDMQKELLLFLRNYAHHINVSLLFVPSSVLYNKRSMDLMVENGFIPQGGYSNLDSLKFVNSSLQTCKKFTGRKGYAFIYETKKDHLSYLKQFRKDLNSLQKEIKHSFPLCMIDEIDYFKYSTNYYYEGFRSRIIFSFENNSICIRDKELELEHVYEDYPALQTFFHQILETIQTKKRLSNLFDPPKEHFKKLILKFSFNIDYVSLFNSLSSYIQPAKIEHKSGTEKSYNIVHDLNLRNIEGFKLVKIFHLYMVVTPGQDINDFRLFLEKEEALTYLEERIEKHVKTMILQLRKEPR